jgi:hypothetical protein
LPALVAVIGFQDGKVAHEHIHWDQAAVLSQLGLLDHHVTGPASQVRRGC